MKKIRFLTLLLVFAVLLVGCEKSNQIIVAYLSNATAAGSHDFSLKIDFQEDKRVEDKYYDIQIMSDVDDLSIIFFKENEQKISANIAESNRWNSLTSLKYYGLGEESKENFEKLKEALDQIYVFRVDKSAKLIFRVVAGEAEENATKTGQILVNTQPVSQEFVLNCKVD